MNLHICEVTAKIGVQQLLQTSQKHQQQFIESNAFSLAESLYEGNGTSVGLYDGETLVGYAMYGWYSVKHKSVWLDKLYD